MKKDAEGRLRRTLLRSGLPEDALGLGARVTMLGRTGVRVEGTKGIVQLGTDCIRLTVEGGVLSIGGQGMRLLWLDADAALIEGAPVDTVTYGAIAGRK